MVNVFTSTGRGFYQPLAIEGKRQRLKPLGSRGCHGANTFCGSVACKAEVVG